MKNETKVYVGMDVHKDSVMIAGVCAAENRSGYPELYHRHLDDFGAVFAEVVRLARRMGWLRRRRPVSRVKSQENA